MKKLSKKDALDKVKELFERASKAISQDQSRVWVKKALFVRNRHKLRLPLALKTRFCKKCKVWWIHGKNLRLRVRPGKIVRLCLACKHIARKPFK